MLKRLVGVNVNSLGSDKKKEMHFIELAQAVREADKFRLKTDTARTCGRLSCDLGPGGPFPNHYVVAGHM